MVVAARGAGIRLLGFASNIVLARLLTPNDFGVMAFGLTILAFASAFADIGLAPGLIRGPHTPSVPELSAVLGFQLSVTSIVAIGVSVAALFGGDAIAVGALFTWCLPLGSMRLANAVLLERDLRFGPIARAELMETGLASATSVVLVAAGAGVFGLPIGGMVGAAVASGYLIATGPAGLVRPRLDGGVIKRLAGFGAAFQVASLINLVRDQGIVLMTGLVGSTMLLGYWSLVYRIMQAPALLFESLWRVSFPGMARLIEQGGDARSDVQRGLRLGTYVTATVLVGLAAASHPLIGAVFGARWEPISRTVSLAALALLIGGPVSVASAGFLLAVGKTRQLILANALQVVAWVVVLAVLIPKIGIRAHGLAAIVASTSEAIVFARALKTQIDVSVLKAIVPGSLLAVACASVGYAATYDADASLLVGLGTAAAVTALFLVTAAVVLKHETRQMLRLLGGLRSPRRSVVLSS